MTSRKSIVAVGRLMADIAKDEPLRLGESVTIEGGREVFTVVGFELDGECVKLDDGKERFTVYAHRLTKRATKGDGA